MTPDSDSALKAGLLAHDELADSQQDAVEKGVISTASEFATQSERPSTTQVNRFYVRVFGLRLAMEALAAGMTYAAVLLSAGWHSDIALNGVMIGWSMYFLAWTWCAKGAIAGRRVVYVAVVLLPFLISLGYVSAIDLLHEDAHEHVCIAVAMYLAAQTMRFAVGAVVLTRLVPNETPAQTGLRATKAGWLGMGSGVAIVVAWWIQYGPGLPSNGTQWTALTVVGLLLAITALFNVETLSLVHLAPSNYVFVAALHLNAGNSAIRAAMEKLDGVEIPPALDDAVAPALPSDAPPTPEWIAKRQFLAKVNAIALAYGVVSTLIGALMCFFLSFSAQPFTWFVIVPAHFAARYLALQKREAGIAAAVVCDGLLMVATKAAVEWWYHSNDQDVMVIAGVIVGVPPAIRFVRNAGSWLMMRFTSQVFSLSAGLSTTAFMFAGLFVTPFSIGFLGGFEDDLGGTPYKSFMLPAALYTLCVAVLAALPFQTLALVNVRSDDAYAVATMEGNMGIYVWMFKYTPYSLNLEKDDKDMCSGGNSDSGTEAPSDDEAETNGPGRDRTSFLQLICAAHVLRAIVQFTSALFTLDSPPWLLVLNVPMVFVFMMATMYFRHRWFGILFAFLHDVSIGIAFAGLDELYTHLVFRNKDLSPERLADCVRCLRELYTVAYFSAAATKWGSLYPLRMASRRRCWAGGIAGAVATIAICVWYNRAIGWQSEDELGLSRYDWALLCFVAFIAINAATPGAIRERRPILALPRDEWLMAAMFGGGISAGQRNLANAMGKPVGVRQLQLGTEDCV